MTPNLLLYQLLLVALVSPLWVWTAIDPESKLLLSMQVGDESMQMLGITPLQPVPRRLCRDTIA